MAVQPKPKPEAATPKADTPPSKSFEHLIARWTRILGLSTIALFVATAVSAYFLFETDHTLKKQVDAARIQLRPYMGVRDYIAVPVLQKTPGQADTITGANFTTIWKNFGATPARQSQQWISVKWMSNEVEPDFTKPVERLAEQSVYSLSPGEERASAGVGVSAAEIGRAASHNGRIFFWGNVDYRDFVSGTDVHHFHFCLVADVADKLVVGFSLYKPECNYSD